MLKESRLIKLKNRRVFVFKYDEGYLFQFKKLVGYKDIKITELKLSNEASEALLVCLASSFGSFSSKMEPFIIEYKNKS
jgi:hypothetical protein